MTPSAQSLWQDLISIRETAPLIHNITNYVVMNNTANALLALGASPVMAHAFNEVEEMVNLAAALVINIGTLNDDWIAAMEKAMLCAKKLNKPIIFDPVGAGATSYRTETTKKLLSIATPTVIRGNASEIAAISNQHIMTKGVDSTQDSQTVVTVAQTLANLYQCTIVISGAVDFIVSQERTFQLKNGHPLMSKVTGMGCTATALIGAFLAVNSDATIAATHAMAIMGIAGEIAAEKSAGPGSLQVNFLDILYNLKAEDIANRLKLTTN
ncbi:hydroxyethylthiazole kinase [Phormidium sp. LEGE 05292]|uniref:hydroxyethylthiazole kinase n=1 Tax=[Phormidium] sp. LEGE 05292 TaxID=767427 RepID=UPI001880CEC9|nr:hydroxyethylthiazole kinase [Phormidium sp. LEGE 05292]MBE9224607.1 hydroxyethylthiazole kinase [Phormidium sp. LEGE 05292]